MNTILTLLILTLSFNVHAEVKKCQRTFSDLLQQKQQDFFRLEPGRALNYKYLKGSKNKPTLVLLPGIYSGIPDDFKVINHLQKSGYGILIFATSLHWQSFAGMDSAALPHFEKNPHVTMKSLAKEAQNLIEALEIKNPVVVSLSYSSAMVNHFPYPKIQVAPMIRPSESDPLAAEMARFFELGAFGQVRLLRDMGYQTHWTTKVTGDLLQNPFAFDGHLPQRVIEGYSALSRAIEDFDLSKADFTEKTSRRFVIAENESMIRLKHQIQTFLRALDFGPSQLILVRHSEHDILFSQPLGYETALIELLNTRFQKRVQVGVINPKSRDRSVKWLDKDEIIKLFSYILEFSDSTDTADLTPALTK